MEQDFELWYRRERPRVLATCVALSGDVGVASGAADEAFVRALERWSSVSEMTSPGQACCSCWARESLDAGGFGFDPLRAVRPSQPAAVGAAGPRGDRFGSAVPR